MDVDTRHLRAFVAVVDEGTYTDAAIALRTSQASVTRSVQRLEAVLGHPVLRRSARWISLTPTGARVLPEARRILRVLDRLADAPAAAPGTLTVGHAWAALGSHTSRVLRSWRDREDGDLRLVAHDTPTAGLLEGRCDVAVLRRRPTDPRLDSVHVGDEGRVVALAADHPRRGQQSWTLDDLVDETVLVDVATGTTSDLLWPDADRVPRFLDSRGVDEWLSLVASGRALGVSAAATAAHHPRGDVLFRPLADGPPVAVWCAWWREDPPAGLSAFVEDVRSAYATEDRDRS